MSDLNQIKTQITVTRVRQATSEQLKDKSIQVLKGKFTTKVIEGAVSKINDEGIKTYYNGDYILSSPLEAFKVGELVEGLGKVQQENLNLILQQEQERKLRNKLQSMMMTFDGYPYTFDRDLYSLSNTFTPERRGDGLTAQMIVGLFESKLWIGEASKFYAENGISMAGAAKGEQIIKSILKSPKYPKDTWELLDARFEAISAQILSSEPETAISEKDLMVIEALAERLKAKTSQVEEDISNELM